MTHPTTIHTTLDDWIARGAIPFSVDSPETFNAAVDKTIASLGATRPSIGRLSSTPRWLDSY